MKKNIITALAVLAAAVALVCLVKITAPEDYFGGESPLWESGPSATLSIECEARDALPPELKSERYVPEDGYILRPVKLALSQNDTAYSLLEKAAKYYEIPVDAQGSGESSFGSVYIKGINQLYEFSAGELSGWVYTVNGEYPQESCGSRKIADGDEIRFIFAEGEGAAR